MATAKPLLSPDQFAETIKAKYPEYKDTDNSTLTTAMLKKYPQYKSSVDMSAMNAPAKKGIIGKVGAFEKSNAEQFVAETKQGMENNKEVDKNPNLNLGGKILGNIANVTGEVSDFVGAGLNALGIGKLIGAIPSVGEDGKMSTLSKTLPVAVANLKKSAMHVKSVQDLVSNIQSFADNHPNDTEGVKAVINSLGAYLSVEGLSDIAGVGAKDAVETAGKDATEETVAPKPGEEEPKPIDEPTVKTPGVRAALTPVKSDVKTSFKSLVDSFKGDTTKAKTWITDLFNQEKGRVSNVDIDTPNARLANADLSEAKSTIGKNISTNIASKNETIEKFGSTPVTGFKDAENGDSLVTPKDISNSFTENSNKLLGSTVRLSSSQANVLSSFKTELAALVQKGDLKTYDEFVDTWQNTDLGSSGTNAQKLNAVIASTVHDVNEAAKAAADSVDGGAYRNANSNLNKLYQVKEKLEKGLGDKGAFTGKYGGAANFYKKAAEGDSAAKAALEDIEQATGIPIAQRANIAKFVETFAKKPSLAKVIGDVPGIFITRMGKLRLYNDLVGYLGDPEGAAIQELDKYSKGNFTSTLEKASAEVESDPEAMKLLQQSGMDAKQGAVLLMLGQIQNKASKKDSQ